MGRSRAGCERTHDSAPSFCVCQRPNHKMLRGPSRSLAISGGSFYRLNLDRKRVTGFEGSRVRGFQGSRSALAAGPAKPLDGHEPSHSRGAGLLRPLRRVLHRAINATPGRPGFTQTSTQTVRFARHFTPRRRGTGRAVTGGSSKVTHPRSESGGGSPASNTHPCTGGGHFASLLPLFFWDLGSGIWDLKFEKYGAVQFEQ
jgi:hypothetical protein